MSCAYNQGSGIGVESTVVGCNLGTGHGDILMGSVGKQIVLGLGKASGVQGNSGGASTAAEKASELIKEPSGSAKEVLELPEVGAEGGQGLGTLAEHWGKNIGVATADVPRSPPVSYLSLPVLSQSPGLISSPFRYCSRYRFVPLFESTLVLYQPHPILSDAVSVTPSDQCAQILINPDDLTNSAITITNPDTPLPGPNLTPRSPPTPLLPQISRTAFCLNPAKTVSFSHNPTSPDLPRSVWITSPQLPAQATRARNIFECSVTNAGESRLPSKDSPSAAEPPGTVTHCAGIASYEETTENALPQSPPVDSPAHQQPRRPINATNHQQHHRTLLLTPSKELNPPTTSLETTKIKLDPTTPTTGQEPQTQAMLQPHDLLPDLDRSAVTSAQQMKGPRLPRPDPDNPGTRPKHPRASRR
ncbi:hypothetical protein E4T56_gene639 [Termitomyces sp. T112]|nr:hypothetical protein E4T56_gene639 [Termitomyces sp. T112]